MSSVVCPMRGYGVFSIVSVKVSVGVVIVALMAGPAFAGSSAGSSAGSGSAVAGSALVAKKKPGKGTLSVRVTGSGSYTVTGNGIRKTGTASKSFKVKPGTYVVKAPGGSVKPGKIKVRKGKTMRVTVTFDSVPGTPPAPTPPVTPTPSPTATETPTPPPTNQPEVVQRVSTDATGAQANDDSFGQIWSPDGAQVAFASDASNLVSGDTNGTSDVFVKTLATGAVQRVSTDASGTQTNEGSLGSFGLAWSPDGTRIAFASFASNLVPADTNGDVDLFVKTLATGAVQRITTDANGAQANPSWPGPEWFLDTPVWSPDGTRVAFSSWASNLVPGDTNDRLDVFVKTLATGAIQRVSTDAASAQANHGSYTPVWSPDGTRIAFTSDATNLVVGDTNAKSDVFVKTLAGGAIQRVSTDAAGGQAQGHSDSAAWSPDSSRLAFESRASNLVPGDTNDTRDVFVKTLATGAIQRVSTDAAGAQASDSSDADRYGPSTGPAWSPDGTRIAFSSWASNLVPGDNNDRLDVFVKTLATAAIQRVSTDAAGAQANDGSWSPVWSPDSTRIAFQSNASNLVPEDNNNSLDVFVKTLR